jgi:hypothetical protein
VAVFFLAGNKAKRQDWKMKIEDVDIGRIGTGLLHLKGDEPVEHRSAQALRVDELPH